MLIAQIPTVGQIRCIFDDNFDIFFIISQSGDSNEHHKLIFYEELTNNVFGYRKYTHLSWSTDKLDIYRKSTVFCMQNIVIEK